jgi:DNA-directed RNA polymerase subunit RPC12/RpoP
MDNNRFTCPDCGAALSVDDYTEYVNCPNCGIKLHIPGRTGFVKRTFTNPEGVVLASAEVPSDYVCTDGYDEYWQSEMVPYYYKIKACPDGKGIYMSAFSKELYNDLKNPVLKGMKALVNASTKNGYQKFEEPEVFLQREAEKIAGIKLTPVGRAKLPSYLGTHPQAAITNLQNDINKYTMFVGSPSTVLRSVTDSFMYRYVGRLNDRDVVVLAGIDYEGAELDYTPSGLDVLSDGIGGLVDKLKKKKNNDTPDDQLPFGHGRHVDHVMFGAANTFYAMFFAELEEEASKAFLRFAATAIPDPSLTQRENTLINQKFAMISQQVATNQAIAQQKMMQLQQNQARLQQTLADNARSMSDGIMDSWNKKMASDSRISQARSEATMGINTYTNTYGQNVDVSVSADHVYQNQFGDVYGVSGNALDQDVLNKLNWTSLDKK